MGEARGLFTLGGRMSTTYSSASLPRLCPDALRRQTILCIGEALISKPCLTFPALHFIQASSGPMGDPSHEAALLRALAGGGEEGKGAEGWRTLWRKQRLRLPPYLPQDDQESLLQNPNLRLENEALEKLLKMKFPKFLR
jgi:hypothetical protein